MSNIRRLMMGNVAGDLPSGYTRLEYIETDKGGFFMDLPTFPTDVVVLDCQLPNLPVFEPGTGHIYNPIIYHDDFKQCSLYDQKGWYNGDYFINYNDLDLIVSRDEYDNFVYASPDTERGNIIMSSDAIFYRSSYPNFSNSINMFNCTMTGWGGRGVRIYPFVVRVFCFYIIDPLNGYRHYMIPCVNNNQQEGLYDIIGNVFYPYFIGNQITGSLGDNLTSQYPVNQDITLSFSATSDFSTIGAEYTIPKGSNYVSTVSNFNLRYCSISPKTDGVYYYEWATY